MFRLRPIDPEADFERLADLIRLVWPNDTAQSLREEWRSQNGSIQRYMLGCNDSGRIDGLSLVYRTAAASAGDYRAIVIVDPAHRRRGLGTLLYDEACRFIIDQGGEKIIANVCDDCPEGARFAGQRGFMYVNANFISVLDVAGFDEANFPGAVERVQAKGIAFATLADFGDTEEARRRDFEINNRSALPAYDREEPVSIWDSFEVFRQTVCESNWYRADGQIVAIDNTTSEWIGLCAIGFDVDGHTAFNAYTGIDPRYRRRGIALALKLLGVHCARRHGCTTLRTNNDTRNAPMLAINDKLGYVRQGAMLWYEKLLQPQMSADAHRCAQMI